MKWAAKFSIMSFIFIIQFIKNLNCEVSTELDNADQQMTVATNLSFTSKEHKVIVAEGESIRSIPLLRSRRHMQPACRRARMSPKSSYSSKRRPQRRELTIHACGAALHRRVTEVCASYERVIGLSDARRRRREIGDRIGSPNSVRLALYGTQ